MSYNKARKNANEKWLAENKEKKKIYDYRTKARTFINKFADKEDLAMLKKLIAEKELENGTKK